MHGVERLAGRREIAEVAVARRFGHPQQLDRLPHRVVDAPAQVGVAQRLPGDRPSVRSGFVVDRGDRRRGRGGFGECSGHGMTVWARLRLADGSWFQTAVGHIERIHKVVFAPIGQLVLSGDAQVCWMIGGRDCQPRAIQLEQLRH